MKTKIHTPKYTRMTVFQKSAAAVLVGFFTLSGNEAAAQTEKEKNIGQVQIDVSEAFKANIKSPVKISQQAAYIDTATKKMPVTYNVPSRPLDINFVPDPITPVRISQRRLERLPQNMVRIGVGNYTTPLAEVFLGNSRHTSFQWSAFARHFSTQTGVRDVAFDQTPFHQNLIGFEGKKVWRDHRLTFGVNGSYGGVRYYGIPEAAPDSILNAINTESAPRQLYRNAEIYTRFEKRNISIPGVFRSIGMRVNLFGDNYNAAEETYDFDTEWFVKLRDVPVYFDLDIRYQNTRYDQLDQQPVFFTSVLRPYFRYKDGPFNFTFGLNIATALRPSKAELQTARHQEVYFYPNLQAEVNIIDKVLAAYAGWTGDVNQLSFREIAEMNPYVVSGAELAAQGRQRIFFGVKGQISSRIDYRLETNYHAYRNYALFVRDETALSLLGHRGFRLVYDDINIFNIRGELAYHNSKNLEIMLFGDYNNYEMGVLDRPFHLPEVQFGGRAKHTFKEKIVTELSLAYVTPRWGHAGSEEIYEQRIPAFFDARLGVEYRVNQNLGAFANITNVLSQGYEWWLGYPVQRIRFLMGLNFNF